MHPMSKLCAHVFGRGRSSHHITSKGSNLRSVRYFSCGKSAGSPSEDYRWMPWSLGECRAQVLLTHSCLHLEFLFKSRDAAVGYREPVPTLALPLLHMSASLQTPTKPVSGCDMASCTTLGSVNLTLAPLSIPGWINTAKGTEGNEHYLGTALTGPRTHPRVHLGFPQRCAASEGWCLVSNSMELMIVGGG